jgi:hypothetical protein
VRNRTLTPALIFSTSFALVPACGDDTTNPVAAAQDAGPVVCPNVPAPQKPAAACDVQIASPPVPSYTHVPEGTQITYCTNPPSGGSHYPIWADFQEYTKPVDWPYLVHSMEHGAVVLLYKCDAQGCPAILDAFHKVRDEAPADPLCAQGTKRIVIAPSPTIPTAVAAAAWGKTYTAPCVDLPTLSAFVRDNYGKGPEDLCAPGRSF